MGADSPSFKPAFRVTFARGMVFGGGALVFQKIAAFASQYYLGRVFQDEQYGLFAMAITAAAVGDVFVSGGIKTVVISRADEYASIARTAALVAFWISVAAAILVAATAPIWAYGYYGQPVVMTLLFVLAGSMIILPLGVVHRAKLDSDMRVGVTALIEAGAAAVRHTSLILLAFTGFGVQSFVWPVVLVNLFYVIAARLYAGPLPPSKMDRSLAVSLLHQSKWVILAAIGTMIISRGDYLVAGGFAKHTQEWVGWLGLYFFGYQLCVSLFGLFNNSMKGLLQPAFARMKSNPARQVDDFFRVIRSTMFIAAPLTIVNAFACPLLIHVLWHGKWDQTIGVVQLLSFTEAIRQLHFISFAMLAARARYRTAAAMTMIDGAATILAAFIGCSIGGLLSLTCAIAIQRTVCSLVEAVIVYRSLGGRPFALIDHALRPMLATTIIGLALYLAVCVHVTDPVVRYHWLAASIIPFSMSYLFAARHLAREQYDEAIDLFWRTLGRRRAVDNGRTRLTITRQAAEAIPFDTSRQGSEPSSVARTPRFP